MSTHNIFPDNKLGSKRKILSHSFSKAKKSISASQIDGKKRIQRGAIVQKEEDPSKVYQAKDVQGHLITRG